LPENLKDSQNRSEIQGQAPPPFLKHIISLKLLLNYETSIVCELDDNFQQLSAVQSVYSKGKENKPAKQ
jgi:hypothetical protein